MKTSYTAEALQSSNPKRILCIDDDEDDRVLVSEAITQVNPAIEVVLAENGKRGLEVLKELHQKQALPSLIILDVNMPVMNGRETVVELRNIKEYNRIPIVMFSTGAIRLSESLLASYNVRCEIKPNSTSAIKESVVRILAMMNLHI